MILGHLLALLNTCVAAESDGSSGERCVYTDINETKGLCKNTIPFILTNAIIRPIQSAEGHQTKGVQ